eukprot:COSAG01_NODE_32372_length_582_cov_2.900621_1_plen_72_part_01
MLDGIGVAQAVRCLPPSQIRVGLPELNAPLLDFGRARLEQLLAGMPASIGVAQALRCLPPSQIRVGLPELNA